MYAVTREPDDCIRVRGAHLHNLRDVDVDIPRDRLVAVTGVSGSGKSSLAFGTIHGEAQRRYFDTVAPFARRLIHTAVDPRVRDITGLPPAVALEQRTAQGGSRSSVGTVTTTANTLRMVFSRCGDYPEGLGRLDSDHFSPNTAVGACPECSGLGVVHRPTEDSLVPDPSLSIAEGAIAGWPGAWQGKNYRDITAVLGYDIHRPWRELPQADRDWILFTDEEPVVTVHPEREAHRIQRPYKGTFSSAARYVMRTLAQTQSPTQRARALRHVVSEPCPVCRGRHLHPDALRVTWQGLAIDEAMALPMDELLPIARRRLDGLGPDPADAAGAAEHLMLTDLVDRLGVLDDLGLGHLALGRPTPTVSTGELQRLRLGSLLRSGLFGVVYVLDEPSASLHPRDVESLMGVLRGLVDAGNSVLVVEHDMTVVRQCDWVVDVGPGAGRDGGELMHSGPVPDLGEVTRSVTARYLDEPVHPDEVRDDRPRSATGELVLTGLTLHSLHGVDVTIPLGTLTVVEGISGSGKSSLLTAVHDAVGVSLARVEDLPDDDEDDETEAGDAAYGTAKSLSTNGTGAPTRLVRITQKPIGRTPRSNLATYTGLFDHVRKRFAGTDEAKSRGYAAGRFSFNVASGRCETCQGEGAVSVELLFMPGTYAPCPTCGGRRYNDETLEITWHGLTIADALALTVADALPVFADEPPVRRALEALNALGLGYLTLGQPATELSGGEAQRIKLATELQKERRSPTLYLMDEPSAGLHPADVHRLLRQLHALVDAGHTVVVAEHHPAAVATADWRIEMGPGAGPRGGQVVSADPA
ncbi:excinuclease ABC subunit A [Actinomycetota bacterium]